MKKTLLGLLLLPIIVGGMSIANASDTNCWEGKGIVPTTTYASGIVYGCDGNTPIITIYGDDGKGITIKAMNEGASAIGAKNDNVASYGNSYQWGNNYGFPFASGKDDINISTEYTSTKVDVANYGPVDKSVSGYYDSGMWIPQWQWSTDNRNLRGGSGDENGANGKWGFDTDDFVAINVDDRKGMCDDGYHIPSQGEWAMLMQLRLDKYPRTDTVKTESKDYTLEPDLAWNYICDYYGEIGNDFSSDVLLPFVGYRAYDGTVYAGGYGYYWSSSPIDDVNFARDFGLYPNDLYADYNGIRGYGYAVRCFKDFYVKLPKTLNLFFMSDGKEVGTGEVTENKSFTGTIPSLRKDGYNLEYWYLSGADASTGFDFENTPISGAWADESGNVYFIAKWTKIETKPSGGYSGGGGRSSSKDVISNDSEKSSEQPAGSQVDSSEQAPQNDNSVSSGAIAKDPEKDSPANVSEGQNQQQFTQEFQQAYEFAKEKGITTMPTINDANMNGKLTRIAMAKMLSYYAINVLGMKPDETRINKFNDITDKLDAQYDSGVTLAYQLGIMGINMPDNKFRPNDEVTRAEFATALSRMLYSTPDGKPYYTTHLAKLKAEGILKNDDYKMKELRGYVMIMLMRSASSN